MPVKTEGYSNTTKRAEKTRRRQEGEARDALWRALTPEQQLSELSKRRGQSLRQTARIKARMGI